MKKTYKILSAVCAAAMTLLAAGCGSTEKSKAPSVAVFVPGIMADSPIYANLAAGVQEAIDEYNSTKADADKAKIYIMEAGTNQSEWAQKLTALTAAGEYDVIISSNPSLPEYADPLTKQFPSQKYVFLDAECYDNNNISCVSYNQKDQSYLTGYIAGLMSKSHKVGLVAAQEYPVMNNVLHPYYEKGAADAVEGTTCDFRIVGNWWDASKGAEITDALVSSGVDVILPICGGAAQGVISTATEKGIYLNWFDDNGFAKAPGVIISSCLAKQKTASKEVTLNYLAGKTEWGKTKVVGMQEGYIEFVQDDPLYIQTVPEDVRGKLSTLIEQIQAGTFTVPEL